MFECFRKQKFRKELKKLLENFEKNPDTFSLSNFINIKNNINYCLWFSGEPVELVKMAQNERDSDRLDKPEASKLYPYTLYYGSPRTFYGYSRFIVIQNGCEIEFNVATFTKTIEISVIDTNKYIVIKKLDEPENCEFIDNKELINLLTLLNKIYDRFSKKKGE